MANNKLFIHTFILLSLIGAADYFANTLYLYWTVWWIDMPMHFFAGACVSMAFIWIYSVCISIIGDSKFKVIMIGVLGALIIGLLWEWFELHFAITSLDDGLGYYTDTISDVILDVSGGILAGFYSYFLLTNRNIHG